MPYRLKSRLCLRNNCHFLCFQLHPKADLKSRKFSLFLQPQLDFAE